MSRWLLLALLGLAALANAAAPDVRVQARLAPDSAVMTGATVSLEVDLLVDTWFTDAPVLPTLQLPGAVVTPPTGEARHLNLKLDGKAFFGLRYTYQITPSVAQRFSVPALAFSVQPGPDNVAITVHSQPLSFEAKAPAGGTGEQRLVARQLELTQDIQRSHTPLRAGDSITRRLHIVAQGAQAMLIPPPTFVEVKGLKRYVQTPSVTPLSDGRGGTLGGQRTDSVTYVVSAAGSYRLPAIDVQWSDATSGERHSASVPAIELKAEQGAYQAPFSLSEDLRALGQGAQLRINGHWLELTVLLVLVGALAWAGRAWGRAAWQRLCNWRARRRQAWRDSPGYAWRQARRQWAAEPLRLDGLYLWLRRATGRCTLSSSEHPQAGKTEADLLAFFQALYGVKGDGEHRATDRRHLLQGLRQRVESGKAERPAKHGLNPLNPQQGR
ncbi:BatD family protein [Pseudomonas sp. UFMG81]|uniref:BatD family protein n=1 Tax=Pseudomonas sp. UFMG81 TaxID=2745936 RepID=UPI00188FBBBC|nr:BatD family protein [Pseudomonas sp. UFMG81]